MNLNYSLTREEAELVADWYELEYLTYRHNCAGDRWVAWDAEGFQHTLDRNDLIEVELEKMAASHGIEIISTS